MKFNTKTRYGVRVVLELALNEDKDGGTFQKDIAENQDVSVKYLDHIISSLKKAGLISNMGGKKSGYILTKAAKDITIYDVYAAFEEDLVIIDCLLKDGDCPRKGTCVLKDYWCDLNQSIRTSMAAMNIAQLAEKHKLVNETKPVS
ncbi:MAG: Rrf2 family transcriptional regulator, partial [Bacteroidales bacterium]|nr:Rrf2 family transcriptional regulator [Bacteroidales bacterium]